MSFKWYINRLRGMSSLEIIHRVKEVGLKALAKHRLEGWSRYEGSGSSCTLPGFVDQIAQANEDEKARIIAAADDFLNGNYEALGVQWPKFDISSDTELDALWTLDPITKKAWPRVGEYTFDIKYRDNHLMGDVKYVWELNRLQFLQPISAAYHFTKNRKYSDSIERLIASWYRCNTPFRGIGWNSGIELSLRSISLLVASSLCARSLSEFTTTQISNLISAHGFWLHRYPSRFSSANNHRIAEVSALILIGIACEGFSIQAHAARSVLIDEVERQILSDGMPAEQSPTYGAFTAEFVLLVGYCELMAGRPLPERVWRRLEKLAGYIETISYSSDLVPAFGDDDEGRVLTLATHGTSYACSVSNSISNFLGRSSSLEPTPSGLTGFLFGKPVGNAESPSGMFCFEEGGLTVVKNECAGRKLVVAIDHGPLGYLSLAAHGHADALSLWVSVDDRPIFVDPGTYLYHSGGAWRDWFRGTRSHNTLCLDGKDQSKISGPFNWSHKARAHLNFGRYERGVWEVEAQHDGYKSEYGVSHIRRISSFDKGFIIFDRLDAPCEFSSELIFQLPIGAEVRQEGHSTVKITDAVGFLATVVFPGFGELEVQAGGDIGNGGWVSPRFSHKLPAQRISWTGVIPEDGVTISVFLS